MSLIFGGLSTIRDRSGLFKVKRDLGVGEYVWHCQLDPKADKPFGGVMIWAWALASSNDFEADLGIWPFFSSPDSIVVTSGQTYVLTEDNAWGGEIEDLTEDGTVWVAMHSNGGNWEIPRKVNGLILDVPPLTEFYAGLRVRSGKANVLMGYSSLL